MISLVCRRSASSFALSWKLPRRSDNSLKVLCFVFDSRGVVVILVDLRLLLPSCLRPRLSRAWNQTWKRVVNTRHGHNSSVSGRFGQTVCRIPNTSRHTCSSKDPAQASVTGKRSVGVDHSESTYSTTTQRLQLNGDTRSCRSFLAEKNCDNPTYRCLRRSWYSLDPKKDFMILKFRPACISRFLSRSEPSSFQQSIIHTERDRRTLQVDVLETFEKLVVVGHCRWFTAQFPNFGTALHRPGNTFKIRQSVARDNRVSQEYTPWK